MDDKSPKLNKQDKLAIDEAIKSSHGASPQLL